MIGQAHQATRGWNELGSDFMLSMKGRIELIGTLPMSPLKKSSSKIEVSSVFNVCSWISAWHTLFMRCSWRWFNSSSELLESLEVLFAFLLELVEVEKCKHSSSIVRLSRASRRSEPSSPGTGAETAFWF